MVWEVCVGGVCGVGSVWEGGGAIVIVQNIQ